MKKSTTIVLVSVILLFIATAALWFINGGGARYDGDGSVIVFSDNGDTVCEADLEYIKGFDAEKFETTIRSSVLKPTDVEYKGVLLKNLFSVMGISLEDKTRVVVKGIDGYQAFLSMEELDKKDIYIAYEMDGKPLKPKEKGGFGPFQLVIPGDPYSQRWCKFVCEVCVI